MFSNALSLFGHSSPKVIIFTWALTAFVPLPLIFCIFLIRYFPNTFTGLKFSSILPRVRRGNNNSRFSFSSNRSASTPSSHTLAVSTTSSYTLPALNLRSNTPPPGHISNPRAHPSPSTPQKSSPDSSRNPTVPPTSKASPNSNGSSKKPTILSGSSNLFFPASESPKCLSFLEPPSVTSTPRKSYSRLPPNNPRKPSVPCLEIATTPVVRYRRLRKLFLVSAFLLFLVSALYVLEGFAIAAAQDYAHVRVLSHANGKGGLGKGKENERWLIPWSVYVVIEGGLMLWAVWMVNGSRRMARKCALDRDERKEDDNKRPREDGSGDIELQDFGNDEEKETFLTANQTGHEDIFRDELNGRANNTMDEEEEKEWKALGFYRTSECPEERTSPANSHKPKMVSALQQDTHFVSPNGEGSSSGPSYSDGSGFDGYMDESGIPLPDLPGAVKQWQAERSLAEMKLQRRGSDTREFGPDLEESSSITQDQDTLLQVEPRGTPRKDLRNSWQQGDDTKQNPEQQSKCSKGKGKGKEKAEPETPIIDEGKGKENNNVDNQQPETPKFDLPTGIDLNNDYKFIDGLPYPIIPLPKRHHKPTSTLEPPRTPINNNNNNIDDIAYPFPFPYPITPSPTPSFSSSTSSYRPHRLPPPPPPGPKPNFLARSPFNNTNNTPPQTPTRLNNLQPQTPPPPPPPAARGPASRNFTFSPPSSPYAASPTFTPHHLQASPSFSSSGLLPTPPSSAVARGMQTQPAHRIPTGHGNAGLLPGRVFTLSGSSPTLPSSTSPPGLTSSSPLPSSPFSSSPLPSSSPLAYPYSCSSPSSSPSSPLRIPTGRTKIVRRATVGRGKRSSYRRLGSGLGTVREMDVCGGEEEGAGWF